jgi:hypothetical protein
MGCAPRHISTAFTLHLTPKEAHILKELNSQVVITEQECEELLIWPTVFMQKLAIL